MEITRRPNALRWMGLVALLAACALALSGCAAGGDQAQQQDEAEPAPIVSVLPARPGLAPAGPVKSLTAADYPTAVLGYADAGLTVSLEQAGFRRGAWRTWTGPNGATLVAVVALWDDGDAAAAISGSAANAIVPGGTFWTPSQFGGSQGKRDANARVLAVIVGKVSLVLRAVGPVSDATMLRQMDLMFQSAVGEDRQGTSANG